MLDSVARYVASEFIKIDEIILNVRKRTNIFYANEYRGIKLIFN